jgi:hypothetical protein
MVKKLWENHQYKALGFLKEILKKLDKLRLGNIEFVKFINKSSFHARRLQINIEHLKKYHLILQLDLKKLILQFVKELLNQVI